MRDAAMIQLESPLTTSCSTESPTAPVGNHDRRPLNPNGQRLLNQSSASLASWTGYMVSLRLIHNHYQLFPPWAGCHHYPAWRRPSLTHRPAWPTTSSYLQTPSAGCGEHPEHSVQRLGLAKGQPHTCSEGNPNPLLVSRHSLHPSRDSIIPRQYVIALSTIGKDYGGNGG